MLVFPLRGGSPNARPSDVSCRPSDVSCRPSDGSCRPSDISCRPSEVFHILLTSYGHRRIPNPGGRSRNTPPATQVVGVFGGDTNGWDRGWGRRGVETSQRTAATITFQHAQPSFAIALSCSEGRHGSSGFQARRVGKWRRAAGSDFGIGAPSS